MNNERFRRTDGYAAYAIFDGMTYRSVTRIRRLRIRNDVDSEHAGHDDEWIIVVTRLDNAVDADHRVGSKDVGGIDTNGTLGGECGVRYENHAVDERHGIHEPNHDYRYVTAAQWDAGVEEYARDQRMKESSPTSQAVDAMTRSATDVAGNTVINANHAVPVTKYSSNAEKLALFRSLFHGRDDVHAHGYWNRKSQRIGYTPACAHEWKRGICGKPKQSCATCPYRTFVPLSDATLLNHFRISRDDLNNVIGIYPMEEGNQTWFLAIDFDKTGWQSEVSCMRDVCEQHGLPYAVERSRSGNGAHLWLFFERQMPAAMARRFGESLLTLGMKAGGVTEFDSYDRLFPNQDTIPAGGFGNLIALPLQHRAREQGNSVFVNERFEPYDDQWAFLSSLRRISEQTVREIVALTPEGSLGGLAEFETDGLLTMGRETVSELTPAKQIDHCDAMPSNITVTESNMLAIDTADVPPAALNSIRRLAAFTNPDFRRAQAMRQTTYGKSRILYLGAEHGGKLFLPRGCRQSLIDLLERSGANVGVVDERNSGKSIRVGFVGELRDRQQAAVDDMLTHDNGILVAPTGFGKTVVAAAMIAERQVNTLVVLRSTALLDQWRQSLGRFLDINESVPAKYTKSGRLAKHQPTPIGLLGGGHNDVHGIVDIAIAQSLFSKGDIADTRTVSELVRQYGMVIFDECHHVAAAGHEAIARAANARYVYGLTGTPRREDGLQPVMFMQIGPIRHTVDVDEQIATQHFKRTLMPRFTTFHAELDASATYNDYVDAACASETRNRMVVEDAWRVIEAGGTPLILTKRVNHAKTLADLLRTRGCEHVLLLYGGDSKKMRAEKLRQVRTLPNDVRYALVATISYAGEGLDIPRLDTLLLSAPISWEGPVAQAVGRLHRDFEGKHDVVVYDYADVGVAMLERMYRKRLKAYAKLGYALAQGRFAGTAALASADVLPATANVLAGHVGVAGETTARMMFAADYASQLRDDIRASRKTVTIAATYVTRHGIKAFERVLRDAVARGVNVEVTLRLPANASPTSSSRTRSAADLLRGVGCRVCYVEWCADCAVYDGNLVWYGTIPLLAIGDGAAQAKTNSHEDECSLRVRDSTVAKLLLGNLGQGMRPLLS